VARDRQRSKARRQRHTPAPEPTKHAFPDADQARLAESGVEPPPRELGESRADDREEAQTALGRPAEHHRPKRGRLLTFLGHVVDELRRVQWPDRRQVGQGTIVTLGFVVVAGGYLGLLDAIWKPLIEAIL
jgi:preprotein translocase SecE subunit